MNAVTYTEAQALDSRANVLQAADPSKHMILVPLSRLVLRPTGRNVRKTVPRMSIPSWPRAFSAWACCKTDRDSRRR